MTDVEPTYVDPEESAVSDTNDEQGQLELDLLDEDEASDDYDPTAVVDDETGELGLHSEEEHPLQADVPKGAV